jgi:hypothetical protein
VGWKQSLVVSLAPMGEGNLVVRNGDCKSEQVPMVEVMITVEGAKLQWMLLHCYSLSSHSSLLRQQNVQNFVWTQETSGFDNWKGKEKYKSVLMNGKDRYGENRYINKHEN